MKKIKKKSNSQALLSIGTEITEELFLLKELLMNQKISENFFNKLEAFFCSYHKSSHFTSLHFQIIKFSIKLRNSKFHDELWQFNKNASKTLLKQTSEPYFSFVSHFFHLFLQ